MHLLLIIYRFLLGIPDDRDAQLIAIRRDGRTVSQRPEERESWTNWLTFLRWLLFGHHCSQDSFEVPPQKRSSFDQRAQLDGTHVGRGRGPDEASEGR